MIKVDNELQHCEWLLLVYVGLFITVCNMQSQNDTKGMTVGTMRVLLKGRQKSGALFVVGNSVFHNRDLCGINCTCGIYSQPMGKIDTLALYSCMVR